MNDYPEEVVKKLTKQVLEDRRSKKDMENKKMYYLILPYIDEKLCRKVFYILRKQQLLATTRVIFTPGKKLKDTLTKSSLLPTKCNKKNDNTCYSCDDKCMAKNLCYELTCNICYQKYDGETGRCKRHRIWEHFKSAQNKNSATAMGRHYSTHHPTVNIEHGDRPFEAEVLAKCKDFVERQLTQSVLIKHRKPYP